MLCVKFEPNSRAVAYPNSFSLTLMPSHSFSLFSLPLGFVQLVLWALALGSVLIAILWRQSLQLLIPYNTGRLYIIPNHYSSPVHVYII